MTISDGDGQPAAHNTQRTTIDAHQDRPPRQPPPSFPQQHIPSLFPFPLLTMSDESQRPMTQQQLEDEPAQYSEKSALGSGMKSLATGAGAGVFLSAIQNSLAKHDHGAMGIFTRSGGTISLLAATAGMFGFTEAAVANLRGKDDPINGAAGGCAAGLVVGANGGQ